MNDDHRDQRELLGAYVLGQLSGSEESAVRLHLAGCADCQAELDRLRPVARSLQGLDPDALTPTRRPLVRRILVSAASTGLLAASFLVGVWFAGPRNEPPVVPVTVHLGVSSVSATAGLVRHTWGTELQLRASGLADGAAYAVVFVADDGARVPAGSFLGTGSRSLACSVNAALPIDSAAEIMITDPAGKLIIDAQV